MWKNVLLLFASASACSACITNSLDVTLAGEDNHTDVTLSTENSQDSNWIEGKESIPSNSVDVSLAGEGIEAAKRIKKQVSLAKRVDVTTSLAIGESEEKIKQQKNRLIVLV